MVGIIKNAGVTFLVIFNVGLVARIAKILMDGQVDDNQETKKMVKNHLIAGIVINIMPTLALVIANYYQ